LLPIAVLSVWLPGCEAAVAPGPRLPVEEVMVARTDGVGNLNSKTTICVKERREHYVS